MQEAYSGLVYNITHRCQSQFSKPNKDEVDVQKEAKDAPQLNIPKVEKMENKDSVVNKYSSDNDDVDDTKWRLELAWLTKALEPALQVCRWALPTGLFMSNIFLNVILVF